jgi:hypothetical protein
LRTFAAPIPETPDPITATLIQVSTQLYPSRRIEKGGMIQVEISGSQNRRSLMGASTMYHHASFPPSLLSSLFSLILVCSSYRIKSASSHSAYPFSEYSVFREYKHFKQLYQSLIAVYPGVMIPHLPEPTAAVDLVPRLQPFLEDIVSHPTLSSAQCVIAFLQGPIEKFLADYQQVRDEESRRRSSVYLPSLRERMENKFNSFLNGNEVCLSI